MVAEEVRRLADHVRGFADQIGSVTDEIRGGSHAVARSIRESVKAAGAARELVERAAASFDGVSGRDARNHRSLARHRAQRRGAAPARPPGGRGAGAHRPHRARERPGHRGDLHGDHRPDRIDARAVRLGPRAGPHVRSDEEPDRDVQAAGADVDLLYFQLGGAPYAIALEAIADVAPAGPIHPVPLSPPAVLGLGGAARAARSR